jgi:A20-like zinc finger
MSAAPQCAGGCGFFGSEDREGFCSKCFADKEAERAAMGGGGGSGEGSEEQQQKLPENVDWASVSDGFKPPILENYVEKLFTGRKDRSLVVFDFVSHWHPLSSHPVVPGVRTNPTAHLFTRVDLCRNARQETVGTFVRENLLDLIGTQGFQRLMLLRRGGFGREHLLCEDLSSQDGLAALDKMPVADVPAVDVPRGHDTLGGGKFALRGQTRHFIALGVANGMGTDEALAAIREDGGLFSQGPAEGLLPPGVGVHYEQ